MSAEPQTEMKPEMSDTQNTAEEKFKHVERLLDWTGIDGSPFEVSRVSGPFIEIRECALNVDGARALRDWLNEVLQ